MFGAVSEHSVQVVLVQGVGDRDAWRPVSNSRDEPVAVLLVLVALPFGMFVNNFSVLALDQVQWTATAIGLLTAAIGILDIVLQGVLMQALLPRLGERGIIVAGLIAQAVGLASLAIVGSVFAEPWILIVGTLLIGGGQGPATAAMDGVLSQQVGEHEQGWIAGVMQSLNTGVNVISPLIAGVLYASVSHAAPYALGFLLMLGAIIVVGRTQFTSLAKRERGAAEAATRS